jgi:ADP-heptose:LPS heptosyltransferase
MLNFPNAAMAKAQPAPAAIVGLPVKVEVLQKADRFVFPAICWLLTLLRRLLPEPDEATAPKPKSLIFVKLAEQGSTVLAGRALRRAVDWVGRENVYFLCFEENRFILDLMNLVPEKNVFTVPTDSLFGMIFGTLRALRQIRRAKIEAAVDLEFFARFSAAITWLTGARWRSGLHAYFGEGPYRGDLMTHRISYNAHLHTSELFFAIVEGLTRSAQSLPTLDLPANPAPEPESHFVPSSEEIAKVEAMICQHTNQRLLPPLILFNINASDYIPLRRWDSERYQELAVRLLKRFPEVHIVFTGLQSEQAESLRVTRNIGSPRCFSLAGKTTLRELMTLYNLSEVLVTNDSGPAHFATLSSVDVVVLFGPETPKLFAARTSRINVLYANLLCSPCVNAFNNRQSACQNNLCLQAITVDQVQAVVETVYLRRQQT